MPVYFWDNKILFVDDQVAFEEKCCCWRCCHEPQESVPEELSLTLTLPTTGAVEYIVLYNPTTESDLCPMEWAVGGIITNFTITLDEVGEVHRFRIEGAVDDGLGFGYSFGNSGTGATADISFDEDDKCSELTKSGSIVMTDDLGTVHDIPYELIAVI